MVDGGVGLGCVGRDVGMGAGVTVGTMADSEVGSGEEIG